MKMMNTAFSTKGCLLIALALSGCAHEALERQLDQKVSNTPAISTRRELDSRSDKTLESADDLTSGQRDALRSIHGTYLEENAKIQEDSLKLRSILIKDVLTTNFDREEVALIEERLNTLEDRRISALMKAIRDANQILGHWDTGGQRAITDFISESYVNHQIY